MYKKVNKIEVYIWGIRAGAVALDPQLGFYVFAYDKKFLKSSIELSPLELAPAYDVTFAHNPNGEWTNQHLMSVNGKYKNFQRKDLFTVADRFGIGEAHSVVNEVREAIKSWPEFAHIAGVGLAEMERIQKYLLSCQENLLQ